MRAKLALMFGRVRIVALAGIEAAINDAGPARYLFAADEGGGMIWGREAMPDGRLEIISVCCDASAIEG